jgi:RND family efflux transporter MFP subunit
VRKRWLVLGLVVVAGGAGTAVWLNSGDGKTKTPAVSTVAAGTGAVTVGVAATGTLEASNTRSLSFTVDGTVATVKVRAGTVVAENAVLASVDDDDAATAVDDAQDSLDTAEDQLTAAKTAAATAATTVRTAASGTPGGGGSTSSGTDAIFTAQERVNQAEVTLAEAEDALAGTKIKAPIAGSIMSVAGKVGNQVTAGSTFVTLADTDAMRVSADFPEADAGALAVGQPATVTLADRVGQEFAAKVAQVDAVGTSDGTLVTYGVLLSFTKAPADLLVGQSASVEVTTGQVAKALRVPSTAVHDIADGSGAVLVRTGAGSAQRMVEVGLRGDQYTEIKSGLTAGELVVRSW